MLRKRSNSRLGGQAPLPLAKQVNKIVTQRIKELSEKKWVDTKGNPNIYLNSPQVLKLN